MGADPGREYVLTLSCPDKPGIVYAVSSFLVQHSANILASQQYGESPDGRFFMRVHFSVPPPGRQLADLERGFSWVAEAFHMAWQLHDRAARVRTLVMVSRLGHCLNDLLFRWKTGSLPVDVVGVVSNHDDFRELAASYRIPFEHIPVTRETKAQAERQLLDRGRGRGRRAGGAGPLHAGALGRPVQAARRPGDQHPSLLPAELQGRQALPPGPRARRQADRRDRSLRHRGPGRGPDHRAGRGPGRHTM